MQGVEDYRNPDKNRFIEQNYLETFQTAQEMLKKYLRGFDKNSREIVRIEAFIKWFKVKYEETKGSYSHNIIKTTIQNDYDIDEEVQKDILKGCDMVMKSDSMVAITHSDDIDEIIERIEDMIERHDAYNSVPEEKEDWLIKHEKLHGKLPSFEKSPSISKDDLIDALEDKIHLLRNAKHTLGKIEVSMAAARMKHKKLILGSTEEKMAAARINKNDEQYRNHLQVLYRTTSYLFTYYSRDIETIPNATIDGKTMHAVFNQLEGTRKEICQHL
ncbi:MAG: hypothetical protein P1V18_04885 [Candidatus Gracilibacteria bacterium]|nr:hypothetical protein [Candidatus Gracilibacteria bacterium]